MKRDSSTAITFRSIATPSRSCSLTPKQMKDMFKQTSLTSNMMPLWTTSNHAQSTTTKMNDNVNSPSHYTQGDIECIDAIKASMSIWEYRGYLKGNIQKYIWRYNDKLKPQEDLKKAQWYLNQLINSFE